MKNQKPSRCECGQPSRPDAPPKGRDRRCQRCFNLESLQHRVRETTAGNRPFGLDNLGSWLRWEQTEFAASWSRFCRRHNLTTEDWHRPIHHH